MKNANSLRLKQMRHNRKRKAHRATLLRAKLAGQPKPSYLSTWFSNMAVKP